MNSLKPLDFGRRKILTEEEALAMLRNYEPEQKAEPKIIKNPTQKIIGSYARMPQANTYALGAHALREQCIKENNLVHPKLNSVYRPLTFKETIEARVEEYNKGNKVLFNYGFSTSSGIVYKANSTKFKIIPLCEQLIQIPKDFKKEYLPADYSNFKELELDFSKGKYDEGLTQTEVLDHPAWNAMLEDDKALLKAYSDIIFKDYKKSNAMGFYKTDNPSKDQLRPLFVSNIDFVSDADGDDNLNDYGRFLRVTPSSRKKI